MSRNKKRGRPVSEYNREPLKVIEKPVSRVNKWLLFDNDVSDKFCKEFSGDRKKYRRWLCKLWKINEKEFNGLMQKPYNLKAIQIEHISKETGKSVSTVLMACTRDGSLHCQEKELKKFDRDFALTNFYTDVSEELEKEIARYRLRQKLKNVSPK